MAEAAAGARAGPPQDASRLRVSALTRAAELSPLVRRATIGPRSPRRKLEEYSDPLAAPDAPLAAPPAAPLAAPPAARAPPPPEERRCAELLRRREAALADSAGRHFEELLDKMLAKRAEFAELYWRKQVEECERRAQELRRRQLRVLREHEEVERAERSRADEHDGSVNRVLEEQNRAAARFAAITDGHAKICTVYNEMADILQADDDCIKLIHDKYATCLNSIVININNVLETCKIGIITEKEVRQAEILAKNIVNLKNKLLNEIAAIQEEKTRQLEEAERKRQQAEQAKKNEEAKKKEEESQKQFESELQAQLPSEVENTPAQVEPTEAVNTKPVFYSKSNYEYYQHLRTYLQNYEASYQGLSADKTLKKFRFDCQKAVNIPLNAVSSVSGVHIRDKFDKLSKLLKGDRVQVMDTYISAAQHPQGIAYCTALLAKKIVRQGDLLVSSKPEAAFPLASLTIALWAQFPDLGKLVEANFHRDCPYLVPMLLPQKQGQSDQDFYKSRGYTYNDEGVVEKQDKFLTRMSGIFRLCCAIWISKPPRIMNTSNPYGLKYAWKWLASFVNLKPEADICATLLFDFFTVCGSECLKHYGRHFTKIILLICTDYLPILQNIDEGGPKTRLEIFLQEILKTGKISAPSGVLPPNVW